ncbi:MAG: mismatch-specific DNA-glycosylase [Acidimicrobiales bacterium]
MSATKQLRFVIGPGDRTTDDDGGYDHNGDGQAVSLAELPLALADLHRTLPTDAPATLRTTDDTAPAQLIFDAGYSLADILEGAGFAIDRQPQGRQAPAGRSELRLRRQFTLTDTVAPGMHVLVCGLNPSIYSAEVGIGFGRPGNRFWPAAVQSGLVSQPSDPRRALVDHGVGMTDLVKRPTRRADELAKSEYETGLARVRRLVGWAKPALVCFVGLAGWRAVVDRKATAGLQPLHVAADGDLFAETRAYLMPSTSGLNAHSQLPDLVEHLRKAQTLAAQ